MMDTLSTLSVLHTAHLVVLLWSDFSEMISAESFQLAKFTEIFSYDRLSLHLHPKPRDFEVQTTCAAPCCHSPVPHLMIM